MVCISDAIIKTIDKLKREEKSSRIEWNQHHREVDFGSWEAFNRSIRILENELSEHPKKHRGKWIETNNCDDDEWGIWQCSECRATLWSMASNLNGSYDFCPKCGSDMRDWQDE